MSKLFNTLVSESLIIKWAEMLDWLFDDERFSDKKGWTSGYIGSFTKKVKKLPGIGKNNYSYEAIKNLSFPSSKFKNIQIVHSKGEGEGKDLIRHIRNGIAHGKTEIKKEKDILYIEILDYNKKGEQTAFICIPLNHILEIYNVYREVEKSKNSSIIRKRVN